MDGKGKRRHARRALSRMLRKRGAVAGDGRDAPAVMGWAPDEAVSFNDELLDEVCRAMGVGSPGYVSDRATLSTFIPGAFGISRFPSARGRAESAVAERLSAHFGTEITPGELDRPLAEFLRDLHARSPTHRRTASGADRTADGREGQAFDVAREVLGIEAVVTADGRTLPPRAVDQVLMLEADRRHQRNYLRMSRDVAAGGARWLAAYYPSRFAGRPAEARAHAAEGAAYMEGALARTELSLSELAWPGDRGDGGNPRGAWPLGVIFAGGREASAGTPEELVRILEGILGEPFVIVDEWPAD